jgi:hypothetical protein
VQSALAVKAELVSQVVEAEAETFVAAATALLGEKLPEKTKTQPVTKAKIYLYTADP